MSIDIRAREKTYHQNRKVSKMITAANNNIIFTDAGIASTGGPVLKTKIPRNTHL